MTMQDWATRLDAVKGELSELAAQVRRVSAATVSADAPREVLARASAAIATVAADLESYVPMPHPPRYPGGGSAADVTDVFPFDPIIGRLNPLAPPLRVEWQDPLAVGLVRFTVPYEGPPGCVHGGVIAATFDQVLNVANLMRGVAGPTRRLEMRYLKPTPLLVELRFEGWIERVEGNEVHTRGRLLVGDQVTVEAAGDFVQLSHERVMRLLETSPEKPRSESGSTKVVESAAARRRRFRRTGDGT